MSPGRRADPRHLSKLAAICRVRESGYRAAAGANAGRRLHVLLNVYAEQSRQFATSLEQELWRMQPTPPADVFSSVAQLSLPQGRDEDDLLSVCRSAEAQALDAYEDCLDADWPSDVRGLLLQQHNEIRTALRRLDSLRGQPMTEAL